MTGRHAAVLERTNLGAGPRAEALARHRDEVVALIGAYGGRDVHLFGSVARGTDAAHSDIDLVCLTDRPMSLLASLTLHRSLRDLLGHAVDLFSVRDLPPAFLDRIARDAVPL